MDNKLKKEYKRYMIINVIIKFFIDNLEGDNKEKKEYEIMNILERMLLSLANNVKKGDLDEIINPIPESNQIFKNITIELETKHIKLRDNPVQYLIKIFNYWHDYLKEEKYKTEKLLNIIIDSNIFRYGNYERKLADYRIKIFRDKLSQNKVINANEQNKIILIMLIRYSCILSRGQQWNIPADNYKYLHNKYNLVLECFASPINSQLLSIRTKPINFCSLFYDTDKLFGSIGNVFEINLFEVLEKLRINGEDIMISVNPPYVYSIIDSSVILIGKWLDEANKKKQQLNIVFNIPEWPDAEYNKILRDNKYKVFDKILLPNKHYYENTNNPDVIDTYHHEKIIAKFKSHIYVFSINSKIYNKTNQKNKNFNDITTNYEIT